MINNKVNILVGLTLLASFTVVIEYGATAIIDGPKINIIFSGNSSNGIKQNDDSFLEKFTCHHIGSELRGILSRIIIQSAPEFATCIILYNNENCIGRYLEVQGNDISLKPNDNYTEFLSMNVSSYEFCSPWKLRTQNATTYVTVLEPLVSA